MEHKAGFVNIIGKPNVGKSTLMNALLGERLSIATPKAQTTRHRILGLLNEPEYQIVFSDTPGILLPSYKLQERMMNVVNTSFTDADVMVFITDAGEKANIEEHLLERLNVLAVPVLVVLNKIDTITQPEVEALLVTLQTLLPKAEIIPVSALHKFNLQAVLDRVIALIPVSPPYYDKDALTDRPIRFFVSEMIREQILQTYQKEIPYSCEIEIEEYKEEEELIRIRAIIYVMRKSQKGILIGHKGEKLKRVGTQARKNIEAFLEKQIFLQMYVKVDEHWRDEDRKLDKFGYN
jgi:GTP-binding protein Era